ncbi:hypothetical protein CG740_16795 [Streptomyces sp. CB01201]|uniref:hypothetical protein n=1 Tax=Streptomyces sp. CB01201 TaxID=2020324 RepID=UPI000C271A9C|nr:hypothetical protein [Streptomyces sp. CB01201]PJN02041.1 hypothetical protein CG740_16795 [Streptomyces sp. CB01201]
MQLRVIRRHRRRLRLQSQNLPPQLVIDHDISAPVPGPAADLQLCTPPRSARRHCQLQLQLQLQQVMLR